MPHHFSRSRNLFHVPTQDHATKSYLHHISYCFIYYSSIDYTLCNIIISNKFKLESDVDDLICFNVQLFSAKSLTPRWEDVGSFNLDRAMAAAEDIAAPYTQVVFFQ